MAELGTRFTIERVKIGHSLPKAARACALLGKEGAALPSVRVTVAPSLRSAAASPIYTAILHRKCLRLSGAMTR